MHHYSVEACMRGYAHGYALHALHNVAETSVCNASMHVCSWTAAVMASLRSGEWAYDVALETCGCAQASLCMCDGNIFCPDTIPK